MAVSPWPRPVLPLALALSVSACASPRTDSIWGADASLSPGWDRLGSAALTAVTDPFTWGPAAGAVAVQIDGLDEEIADWANEETPIFGGRETAADASDWLRTASLGIYLGTGLAVGGGAIAATAASTALLKEVSERERPLGQDDESYPSGHTATAAVAARLSHDNLRYYDLSEGQALAADAGLAGLALMTGWARVEAGEHYPADILAGAALGNFFAVFMTEAFLQGTVGETVSLNVGPWEDGWRVQLGMEF